MAKPIAAFVRHGDYHQIPDAPSAHQPFALTAAGWRQARAGARELHATVAARGWTLTPVIDSSNMQRAWQTATALAECDESLKIECFDALAERGLGCAANLTVREIRAVLADDPRFDAPPPDWKSDSHYRLPLQGAESLIEAGERVAEHVHNKMAAAGAGEVKVFVGHGAAFRHAAHLLGVFEFADIARLSMHHGRPVFLAYDAAAPCSLVAGEWKRRTRDNDAPD